MLSIIVSNYRDHLKNYLNGFFLKEALLCRYFKLTQINNSLEAELRTKGARDREDLLIVVCKESLLCTTAIFGAFSSQWIFGVLGKQTKRVLNYIAPNNLYCAFSYDFILAYPTIITNFSSIEASLHNLTSYRYVSLFTHWLS